MYMYMYVLMYWSVVCWYRNIAVPRFVNSRPTRPGQSIGTQVRLAHSAFVLISAGTQTCLRHSANKVHAHSTECKQSSTGTVTAVSHKAVNTEHSTALLGKASTRLARDVEIGLLLTAQQSQRACHFDTNKQCQRDHTASLQFMRIWQSY